MTNDRFEIGGRWKVLQISVRSRPEHGPRRLGGHAHAIRRESCSWAAPWARNRRGGGSGSIRRVLFPAHRSDRAFQHSSNPDGFRTDMKFAGAQVQGALRRRRSASLPQIVMPRWTMIALCPKFRIGDIPRDRPPISAVALTAELHVLHDSVEEARFGRIDAIFDLYHDRSAAWGQ